MKPLAKTFEDDGLRYRLEIDGGGGVAFFLTGGGNRRGRFSPRFFFDDDETVEDINLLTVNPITVFRKVKELVVAWVHAERPYMLCYSPSNKRRLPIYRWLSVRLARALPHYFAYELGGTFYFFRRVTADNPNGARDDPETFKSAEPDFA